MAKPDIGTKRICPETGRKFYDLNKDPIVSPYTGKSYPLTYFQSGSAIEVKEELEEAELEAEEDGAPEVVALEEAEDSDGDDAKLPGIEDEEDVEIDDDDDDDDTFLATDDEDDDDDVTDIIGVDKDDEN